MTPEVSPADLHHLNHHHLYAMEWLALDPIDSPVHPVAIAVRTMAQRHKAQLVDGLDYDWLLLRWACNEAVARWKR